MSLVSGKKGIVLSGLRPTGRVHLGNYFGAVRNWVRLQDEYDCYYFVADWHALTSDYEDTSKIRASTLEAVADWIAAGVDPERSTIFVQSMVPEHAELHLLLSMVTPLGWLERVPTYKDQIANLANKDLSNYGFLGYPVLQTADIIMYRANYVPVGEDQVSHLEISREIVRRFNGLYGEVFPEPQPLLTDIPKVPGLDGRKMSKSYANTIDLADSEAELWEKVRSMFTDPARTRREIPGNPDICNLFQFHRLLTAAETREDVDRRCRAAGIGCVEDKKLLFGILEEFLAPMRRRREELIQDPNRLLEILVAGSARARRSAQETMRLVRSAMRLDYDSGRDSAPAR